MKAILLAAGYATRLRPLTDAFAKPLLPIAGRPMIQWIYDKVQEVPEVDGIHLVTNHRFAADFAAWAGALSGRIPVQVHDDGTSTNETRLGAIGDIQFTVRQANLAGEDLLIIAADNLFAFSLKDYVDFWQRKRDGSAVALFDCPRVDLVRQYSSVEVDEDDRLVSFEEKPKEPKTSLVAIATYLYRAADVARIEPYLAEGNSPDQPGNFVAWLHRRTQVYGWRFTGDWLDIGDHEQLLDADNRWRARSGMPTRATYAVT